MSRGFRGPTSSGGSSRGFSSSSSRGSRGVSHSRVGFGRSHTTIFIGGGHRSSNGEGGHPAVALIVGILFVLVGLFVSGIGISQCFVGMSYGEVEAVCVGNDYTQGYYFTRYDYIIDDVEYKNVRSNESWSIAETVGETVTIYYEKDNPEEIYEEKPSSGGTGVAVVFFGLIFAGVGAIPIVIGVKQIKNKGAEGEGLDGDYEVEDEGIEDFENSTQQEDKFTTCQYCGSKYDKNLGACPRCGASK